jgi:surface antigen
MKTAGMTKTFIAAVIKVLVANVPTRAAKKGGDARSKPEQKFRQIRTASALLKLVSIIAMAATLSACGSGGSGSGGGASDGGVATTPIGGAAADTSSPGVTASGGTVTGSSGTASSGGSNVTVAQGQFIDSAVSGLNYSSGGQTGITDVNGTFTYEVGKPVTFSVGGIVIGTAGGKATITPVDLVSGAVDHTDPIVTNIASFLQALNANDNLKNGITITDVTRFLAAGNSINFSQSTSQFAQDTHVQSVVSNLTSANPLGAQKLPDTTTAQNHLAASIKSSLGGLQIGDEIVARPGAASGSNPNACTWYDKQTNPAFRIGGNPAYQCIVVDGQPEQDASKTFQQLNGVHGTVVNTCTTAGLSCTSVWYQIAWDWSPPGVSSKGWSGVSNVLLVPSSPQTQKPDLTDATNRGGYYQSTLNPYSYVNSSTSLSGPNGPSNLVNATWRLDYPDSPSKDGTDLGGHYGNCTWYAYGRMLEKGYTSNQLAVIKNANGRFGNAASWISNAQNAGVKFDDVPQVGDIAAIGVTPGFPDGHVAVVESVNSDLTYTVSESAYSTNDAWNVLWRRRTINLWDHSPIGFDYFIPIGQIAQKTDQAINTISFTPTTLTVGGTATASAAASSELLVTFSSTTPAICSVTAMGGVTGSSAGTCTIAANQAGNTKYNAAPPITGNIAVTGNVLTSPTLSVPTNNATGQSLTPTLQWSGGSATYWQVNIWNVSTNTLFTSAALSSNLSSYTVPNGTLQVGVQYRWNVKACPDAACLSGYQTSGNGYFTTAAAATVMTAPTLTAPTNNATGQSLTPTLQWSGGSATYWQVNIRNLSTSALFTSAALSPNLASYTVPTGTLQAGVQYRWDVTACPDVACSSGYQTSGNGYFTTASVSAAPVIDSLSQNAFNGACSAQQLIIYGSNFVSGATVNLVDQTNNKSYPNRATTFDSSKQLTLSATYGGSAATWSLTVVNPDKSTSSAATFSIVGPSITGVSPNPVPRTNGTQTITFKGSGFLSGSAVLIDDGTGPYAKTPTVLSSGQLTISAYLTSAPASWKASIRNCPNLGDTWSPWFNF